MGERSTECAPRSNQRVTTQLSPTYPKSADPAELFRTFSSANQKRPSPNMKMSTVDSTSIFRYGIEGRKRPICPTWALCDGPCNFEHGQVSRTTPELAPPYLNHDTTPTGGRLSSRQI
ncbi:hypothetical protein TNCV_4131591 [Trichonephila clavipes]|nr:hypothetical protein TNCV_4131591 [Trichonephila clavipes]